MDSLVGPQGGILQRVPVRCRATLLLSSALFPWWSCATLSFFSLNSALLHNKTSPGQPAISRSADDSMGRRGRRQMKFPPVNLTQLFITRSATTFLRPIHMSQTTSSHSKGRRQGRRNESQDIALSKALSWLLRHHLDKSGLEVREGGYVRVDELVSSSAGLH